MNKFSRLVAEAKRIRKERLDLVKRWVLLEESDIPIGSDRWYEKYLLQEKLFK